MNSHGQDSGQAGKTCNMLGLWFLIQEVYHKRLCGLTSVYINFCVLASWQNRARQRWLLIVKNMRQ